MKNKGFSSFLSRKRERIDKHHIVRLLCVDNIITLLEYVNILTAKMIGMFNRPALDTSDNVNINL
jgi:hypothetical protein